MTDRKEITMKPTHLLFLLALFSLYIGLAHGEEPWLEAGVYVQDGSQALEVNGCAVPFVVDWNNDGRKDLLVGQFTSGYIWLFVNQGTDLLPIFSGGEQVESNGSPISVTYG